MKGTRLMKLLTAISLMTLTAIAFGQQGATDEEREEVLSVIRTFFAGMTAKDVEGMRRIMTENGKLYGYREQADGLTIVELTHSEYLGSLAQRDGTPVERFWTPTVMVQDRLATVWTPYDFYSDGVFSHCGINNFSMLKTNDGWKIAGVVFSMQQDDCPSSPLGPFLGVDR